MDKYFMVNAVFSKFCKNYMELKKSLPIRPSEMGVLNIITETEGPHTPAKVAELLGVSKPMLTVHISSLESKGYITKSPSLSDKRAYYIQPTEKAKLLVEREKQELNKLLSKLENRIGKQDFDTLITLTKKANNILEDGD